MPARPMLPPDDLYARLELPVDAAGGDRDRLAGAPQAAPSDVAGSHADDLAKRINVAHDWLSDPDAARALRPRAASRPRVPRQPGRARPPATAPHAPPDAARRAASRPAPRRSTRPRPSSAHLARVRRLTPDELDRLSLAETPPIAFVASISRFLSADQARRASRGSSDASRSALPRRAAGTPRRATRPSATPRRSLLAAVPRRAPLGAVPRARPRAPGPRLGGGDRPAPLRPEHAAVGPAAIDRLRGARPDRAAAGSRGRGPAPTRPRDRRGRAGSRPGRRRRPPGLVGARPARRGRRAARSGAVGGARRSLAGRCTRLVLRHAFAAGGARARLIGPWRDVLLGIEAAAATAAIRDDSRPAPSDGASNRARVAVGLPALVFDGRSGQRPGPTPLIPIHSSP